VLCGTHGDKNAIARLLDINVTTIYRLLARPDWKDVRALYAEEAATAVDLYLSGLNYVARQSWDLNAKLRACIAGLKAHMPHKFSDKSLVIIEGGNSPIRTQNQNINIDLELLNGLSVETKREILTLIENSERPS
jgi:hypothetical protein